MSFCGGVDARVRRTSAAREAACAACHHVAQEAKLRMLKRSVSFVCHATRVAWQLCSCALCVRRHTSEQRHGMLRSRPLLCVHVKGAGAVCGLRGRVCGLRNAECGTALETRSGTVVSVT